MTAPAASSVAQAWLRAIEAEQVAAFGYGTLGPHLTAGAHASLAQDCERAHRNLVAAGAAAAAGVLHGQPTALPNYQLPNAVTDDASAQRLAVTLEQAGASAWRFVLAQLAGAAIIDQPSWAFALAALTDSAVRAVRWRRISAVAGASVAFPGI